MLDPAASLADPAVHTVVSWLGTYFVHSTVLIGGVWAFNRFLPLDSLTRSLLWKMSLVGGLFTATLQTGLGVEPLFGSVNVEAGSLAPGEPPLAPATAIAPPPPPVHAMAMPVAVPQVHACVGCEPQVLVVSDEGVTAVFAAPAHVRVEHAAFLEPVILGDSTAYPEPALMPAAALPAPPTPPLVTAAPGARESEAGAAAWIFAGLIALGATASLGRLGVTAIRLRRGLRGRTPLRQGPLRERLARLMAHVRVPQDSVRLTMSERVGSPMALASREIVVPARAHGLAPRQQEAMLAHELAHVLRRDPAWQVLASVLEAALFFQPLNRVARRGMQEAAEELCDDWAVRHTGSGLHLARCLTEVAQWPGRTDLAGKFASPMAGKSSLLVRRVERLLDARTRERGRWARRWRGLLGAALLAMVGLGAPGLSLSVARAEVPEPPVPPDPPELMPEPTFVSAAPGAPPTTVLGAAPVPPMPPTTVLGVPPTPPMATAFGAAPSTPAAAPGTVGSLTAKQRRALRRAERHEQKAVELRVHEVPPASSVHVFVPENHVVPAPKLHVMPVPPTPPPPHARFSVPPTPPTPPSPPAYRFAVASDDDDDDDADDDSCSGDYGVYHGQVVVGPRAEKLVREGAKMAVKAKVIDAKQLRDLERAAAAIAKQASKLDAAKIEALKARAEALARRAPELSPQQLAELAGRAGKIAAEVERKVEHLDLAGLADALEDLDVDGIAEEVEREVERSLRASGHGRDWTAAEAQRAAMREQRRAEREHDMGQREVQREARAEQRRVDRERLQVEAEARRAQAEGRRVAEEARRVQRARARAGEAVRREVERALRDNVIDAEEQRRIEDAARKAGEAG
ncbi:M56 family metallopeptidase [Nannocystis punicea]|uniref:Peptidase M56 domain-containing protein n=1 Tax=Nannocystis punicea TaxID=2995304 RepID=A0ABY7H9P5_9BACT|nr:M56 family metallopeptidase [Nannocystis poenicansa]WAS95977.1 hypothetical protein O0S08_07410 [Nannocystis poenicansa]